LSVGCQQLTELRDSFQEGDGHCLSLGFVVFHAVADFRLRDDALFVLQGAGDLPRELIVQTIDEVAYVVGNIADVQPFASAIAGIEDFLEVFGATDDLLVIWQGAVAKVIDRSGLLVSRDDAVS
jgi:hypothetical protein